MSPDEPVPNPIDPHAGLPDPMPLTPEAGEDILGADANGA